jgi:branched-chain amino acid transport system permease protein
VPTSRERLVNAITFAVIVGVLAALPAVGATGRMINLAALSAMWAAAVFGLYLSYALAGQMTAASVTVWAASAFSVALAANEWAPPLPVLFLIGVLAGLVTGGIVALPVLRASGHYFVVVTFAVVELAGVIGRNWALIDNRGAGVFVLYTPSLGPWHLERLEDSLWLACVCVVVAFVAVDLLTHSRLGRRWLTVRENEILAATVGCPIRFYKWLVLAIGGAVTGVAATLPTVLTNHVQMADFGLSAAIVFFIALIIGGRRTIVGPLVGAMFWFLGPELLGVDPLLGQALFGVLLAVTIIVSPDGVLIGVRRGLAAVFRLLRRGRGPGKGPAADLEARGDAVSAGEAPPSPPAPGEAAPAPIAEVQGR